VPWNQWHQQHPHSSWNQWHNIYHQS
jgi:hypothetical protein